MLRAILITKLLALYFVLNDTPHENKDRENQKCRDHMSRRSREESSREKANPRRWWLKPSLIGLGVSGAHARALSAVP